MDVFFHPDGVAVIGASDTPPKGGYHILRNILGEYKGRVYAVNPRLDTCQGIPCYHDIDDIPENFDIAIYFVAAKLLPEAIVKCSRKGVKGIIIQCAGFSESGEEGQALQKQCVELASSLGIRLWGPNCMGYIDAHTRHVFSFYNEDSWKTIMKPGNVALVVQSGMLSAAFLMMVLERGMPLSKICSLGNKCDVDETEVLEYLIEDPDTDVIGFYVESIPRGRRFYELARMTDKTIVMIKGGRSEMGARAALSHTASMAGNHAIFRGAFAQAGIIEVEDVSELADFCRGFSMTNNIKPDGDMAVYTFSGAGGIVGADLFHDQGMQLAELEPQTIEALKEVFPPWMPPANPVDLWPAIDRHGHDKVLPCVSDALMNDPNVGAVMVHLIPAMIKPEQLESLARLKDELGKPVAVWLVGVSEYAIPIRKALEDMGLPCFEDIRSCVAFLSAAKKYARRLAEKAPQPEEYQYIAAQ